MYILGILSLLQVCFLPGYIVFRLLNIRENLIFTSVGICFVSLTINYLFVLMATALGIYTRSLVFALFCMEILLCLWFHFSREHSLLNNRVYFERYGALVNDFSKIRYVFIVFMLMLYLCVVCFFALKYVMGNVGAVFTVLDAVVSWNRWAVDWYNNIMPRHTWEYPQLLPAVWSITYMFLGTEKIQIFAKALMPLFGLINLLILGQLAVTMRRLEFALGALCYFFILTFSYGKFVAAGYADIPVSAFSLFALLCVLTASIEHDVEKRDRLVLLGFLICGGAFVVKQTGIYILASYPVFIWLFVVRKSVTPPAGWVKKISFGVMLSLLVSSPWYVYKAVQLYSGKSTSNVQVLVVDIHKGRGFIERAEHTYATAKGKFYKKYSQHAKIPFEKAWKNKTIFFLPVVLLSFFFVLGASFSSLRWVHLIYTLPSMAIWLFLFSYDFRNLQPAVPFVSLAVGSGLLLVPSFVFNKFVEGPPYESVVRVESIETKSIGKPLSYLFIGLIIFILVVLPFKFSDDYLEAIQLKEQQKIGEPALNKELYAYHKTVAIQGKVLTSYQMLGYLPELSPLYMLDHFQRFESFVQKEEKADYFLYHIRSASQDIVSYLQKKIDSGEYQVVFRSDQWIFVEKP